MNGLQYFFCAAKVQVFFMFKKLQRIICKTYPLQSKNIFFIFVPAFGGICIRVGYEPDFV